MHEENKSTPVPMAFMRFLLAIHKDEGSCYGVTVPDVPGCFSAGDTLDEAIDQANEAIFGHLALMLDDGQMLPAAQPFEAHRANPEYADAIWSYAEVDLSTLDDKAERVNITLPRRVLALIDKHAKAHHETRSGFLARAALAEMRG